ncbi:MAG: CopG family transcriptional regulator [Chloroflexi bacterium]|nr:CopG family transcriptional regulator [Chloroflexota bacterium]
MRTTVDLDPDVAAAVDGLRRQRRMRMSEAVNLLARAGMSAGPRKSTFRQRSAPIGLRIDITNIAEALEVLDEPARRC